MTWWDDFANNLATDLGPLISLFGEEPTKQYLSETTLFEDVIIFAMAPIGILTALVSVIRVCGSPSLRAFIGRAQEGEGNAEVELQSSTSRNVGELYNNGGVARVFGAPKLLEIMFDPEASTEEFYHNDPKKLTAGIHWPRDFFNNLNKRSEWAENPPRKREDVENSSGDSNDDEDFALKPNLSLNVGIQQRDRPWFIAAAILGIALQSGVLIWAGFSRYTFHLVQANSSADYAVPMTVIGTILVSCGVGLSALLIDKSTEERWFQRDENLTKFQTQIYWIQPGNQTIGDQAFDSFAYTEKTRLSEYVTSWKKTRQDETRKRRMESLVWIAVGSTMFGFILQFLGLRACHSSVSVAQLGTMLIMSIVRAGLRTRRLKESQNLMGCNPDQFAGHELDWLALRLGDNGESQRKWQIAYVGTDYSKTSTPRYHRNSVALCIEEEFQLVGFRETKTAYEDGLKYQPEEWARGFRSTRVGMLPRNPVRTFFYRCRLAHMTENWTDTLVPLRKTVRALANAINLTADYIFATLPENDEWAEKWAKSHTILWPIKCRFPLQSKCDEGATEIFIALRRLFDDNGSISSNWAVDLHELEAVLGLQIWALKEPEEEKDHQGNSGIRILWELPRNSDFDILSLEYDMWRESRQPAVKEQTVYPPWSNEVSSSEIGAQQTRVRTGWQNISDKIHNGANIKVLALPTRLPLTKLYAQEIFSLFFSAVIRTRTGISPFNSPTRHKLKHEIVSRVQDIFGESELGSPEDALLCTIPALKLQKKTETALHIAARGKEEEMKILEDLLDGQAGSNTKSSNGGKTPDKSDRQLSLVNRLLKRAKPVDINSRGAKGWTALLYAVNERYFKITEVLLAKGAEVDLGDEDDTTPLSWAILEKSDFKIIKLLLDKNANTNLKNKWGISALHWAATVTSEEVTSESKMGQEATATSEEIIISELKRCRADFAARDEDGDTPLHWAAQRQSVKAIRSLLKANPDLAIINSKNKDGKTPLHLAADSPTDCTADCPADCEVKTSLWNAMKLLLDHGANSTIRDNNGKSPLSVASETKKKKKEWMKNLEEYVKSKEQSGNDHKKRPKGRERGEDREDEDSKDKSPKDGSSKDGSSKDGSPRDGGPKDVGSKDGGSKDGGSKDGDAKDGSSRDEKA